MMDLKKIKEAIEKGKKHLLEYSKFLNELDLDKSELTIVVASLQQYMESEELWEEVFE